MAPIVHGLERDYWGKIQFSYLDIDDARTDQFKQHFGYRYQPEYYLLDGGGQVLKKWVGPVLAEDFTMAFDAALAAQP